MEFDVANRGRCESLHDGELRVRRIGTRICSTSSTRDGTLLRCNADDGPLGTLIEMVNYGKPAREQCPRLVTRTRWLAKADIALGRIHLAG